MTDNDVCASERQEFVEALRALENENGVLRGCVESVAACHVCELCAESARLTLDLLRNAK